MDVGQPMRELRNCVESADYAGYDPYDALNSTLLRFFSFDNKWVRIAFTQAAKKCPINTRPLLGVRKGHNPKGIGLFLWAYSKLFAIEGRTEYLTQIDYLLELLERLKSQGYSGNCFVSGSSKSSISKFCGL